MATTALTRHFSRSRLFPALLGLVMAGQFLAPALVFGQENEGPFHQGVAAFKSGDYDQSIADFTQAIQLNPQYAKAYFWRAFVYMTKSDDDLAIADLNQAVKINPQYAQAYFRRAFVYMLKDNYDQAVGDLNQAIQIDPKFTKAYFRRANACMMSGHYDQAIVDINQVIRIDPKFPQAHDKLCFLYMLKGDYAQAISDLNQAILADPENPFVYNRLAWLLATCPEAGFRNGRKAVENATTACELTQWKVSAQLDTLAAACAEAGDFVDAMKWETQAISGQSDEGILADQKKRLALYQSYQPYHVDKYVPKLEAVVE